MLNQLQYSLEYDGAYVGFQDSWMDLLWYVSEGENSVFWGSGLISLYKIMKRTIDCLMIIQ